MAVSPVAICNVALGWLGGNLIISLDDSSVEAKLCKANYVMLRDAVLEERAWTFAVKRLEPAQLIELPLYGYDKAFQIPPEVIRVLQVSRAGADVTSGTVGGSFLSTVRGGTGLGRETRIDWDREGDQILCNNSERIYIRALIRIEDTTKFTPAFDQAFAARMAMELAIPIAGSRSLQKDMAQLYNNKIAMAAATDGMQGRSQNVRADAFTVVR